MKDENPFASPTATWSDSDEIATRRYEMFGMRIPEWLDIRRWRFMMVVSAFLLFDLMWTVELLETWRWEIDRYVVLGIDALFALGGLGVIFCLASIKKTGIVD